MLRKRWKPDNLKPEKKLPAFRPFFFACPAKWHGRATSGPKKKKGNLDEFGPPVRSTGLPVQTGTGPKTEFIQSHGPRIGPKRTGPVRSAPVRAGPRSGPVLDRKLNTPRHNNDPPLLRDRLQFP